MVLSNAVMRSIAYAMTNLNEFNFWNIEKKTNNHHAYINLYILTYPTQIVYFSFIVSRCDTKW